MGEFQPPDDEDTRDDDERFEHSIRNVSRYLPTTVGATLIGMERVDIPDVFDGSGGPYVCAAAYDRLLRAYDELRSHYRDDDIVGGSEPCPICCARPGEPHITR